VTTEDEARRRRRDVMRRLEPRYDALSPAALGEDGGGVEGFAHALFLGIYSAEGLLRALRHYGVIALIEARGIGGVAMDLDTSDPFLHVARLRDGGGELLIELRARVLLGKDAGAPGRLGPLTFLDIEWLAAEDPHRSFDPSRPPLPGQRRPGLGVGPELEELMALMSRRLGAAGVIAHPQWMHNAALYHPRWRFADATEEGRFAALLRDLMAASLPQVSWGVHLGCVTDEQGRVVEWKPGPQILARTADARRHFHNPVWRAARFAAKATAGFHLDTWLLGQRLAERGVQLPG
jgi:hypothetical protein